MARIIWMGSWWVGYWLVVASAGIAWAEPSPSIVLQPHVEMQLLADVQSVEPSVPFRVAVRARLEDGWHIYWKNPGDSGLPTQFEWSLPPGFESGEMLWPTPKRFEVGSIVNFGYEGETAWVMPVTPPAVFENGSTVIAVQMNWLVCQKECVPGKATLRLSMPTGTRGGAAVQIPANRALIDHYVARSPRVPWPGSIEWVSQRGMSQVHLVLPSGVSAETFRSGRWEFFPLTPDWVTYREVPRIEIRKDRLIVEMKETGDPFPSRLAGWLLDRQGRSQKAWIIEFPSGVFSEGDTDSKSLSLVTVLVFAFLGGLLLNLMPCVFPVLAIKVMSVIKQTAGQKNKMRVHALIYSAGVIATFLVLAGILAALRAGGEKLGWGFQLQSPPFVMFLALLFFGFGLNLSGYFEVGTSVMGVGGKWMSRQGWLGSFFTGALAVVVATPCTAPFMGTAMGVALSRPYPVMAGIFVALGAGLALPYVLLCWFPQIVGGLPRAGIWMSRIKESLAFFLYATVIWLLWVLGMQVGHLGVIWYLIAALGLAMGLRFLRSGVVLWKALGLGVILIAATWSISRVSALTQVNAGAETSATSWAVYSQSLLEQTVRQRRPVLVNFTAAWCITCKVNEQGVFASREFEQWVQSRGVVLIRGDWTTRNAEITRALESFGRVGVPLYVAYGRDGKSQILPQILTLGMLQEAIK